MIESGGGRSDALRRNLKEFSESHFDLIVIGGGIFGICAAWDAVLRGLSVALVEEGDFGHATSAVHFKLVHGGIRYLQHADLKRIRESSEERNFLLRVAPHLVRPLPFVVPTYGHGLGGKELLAVGLLLYSLITFDRNRGISDPDRQIPGGRILSKSECESLFPSVASRELTGGGLFYEAQMYNPPRLSLAFLRSAEKVGARVANYLRANRFLMRGDRVIGVLAEDLMSGTEIEIRGSITLNATGPWTHRLLQRALGRPAKVEPTFSRDAWLLVGRSLVSNSVALALPALSRDADAIVSRGHRHLFLIPWRGSTMVGVWHKLHTGQPEDVQLTEQEVTGFISEVNEACPHLNLRLEDVSLLNSGLILFGDKKQTSASHSFGKRSLILDHSDDLGVDGLLSVIGVRYTTARSAAERAVDLVSRKLEIRLPRSRSSDTQVHGGNFESFGLLLREISERCPQLGTQVIDHLARNHGSSYTEVLKYMSQTPSGTVQLGDSAVTEGEVIHAIREEMAQKLSDVVFRRTDLGTRGNPGEAAIERCGFLMARELEWNRSRLELELTETRRDFPRFPSSESKLSLIP